MTGTGFVKWLFVCVGIILSGASNVRAEWEVLRPDLSNIDGFNYVPTDDDPSTPQVNPVTSWRYFNAKSVDKQVELMKSQGVNSLRVFLSYYLWEEGAALGARNPFLINLQRFNKICEKHEIYWMPVLWNSF